MTAAATTARELPGFHLDRSCWRRILVYGLGASGRSAAELLLRRGYAVLGADDSTPVGLEALIAAGLELLPQGAQAPLPAGVDAVIKSPGVAGSRPLLVAARRAGIPVIGEVELAFPWLGGDLIGITGSNGKSTTTALVGALLAGAGHRVEVCGNFGPPLSSRVEGAPGRVFVAELSSFQLEDTVELRPRVATLLNLAADHLDRHGDLAAYGAAKARIFARQGAGCTAVVNDGDDFSRGLALPEGVRRRAFSRRRPVGDGCWLDGGAVVERDGDDIRELFRLDELPLVGVHNLENAMAAALVASSYGARGAGVRAALRSFRGLAHRTEPVRERGGVRYFDDSKGTNPAATEASLEGFEDGSVHLICGGRNKGFDFSAMRPIVARKVRALYLIGEAAEEMGTALEGSAVQVPSGTLARAVEAAAAAARPGEVVLLSPACASFDQFRNFGERGDLFQSLVRGLGEVDG